MKLIVGLGNPGKQYTLTRHNVGWLVLDRLLKESEAERFIPNPKAQAEFAKTTLLDADVLLVKPLTYMNNSGMAVRHLMDYYKAAPEDVIVIHDDKDIPLGTIRVQSDRGSAGHNGVKSLIDHLGTKDFTRIRIGVAPAEPITDTADFVLGTFTKEEQKLLAPVFDNVVHTLSQLL